MYFTQSHKLKIQNDFTSEANFLVNRLANECRKKGFKVKLLDNGFTLRIPVTFTTHSGQNKLNALKVYREGKVKLVHLTNNQIGISVAANLNYLLAISFISGLTVLLVGLYYFEDLIKINFVLIIIAIVLIVLIIGMNTIQKEINEIIDQSIKIK